MKINEYILRIKKLGACEEAVLNAYNYKTSQELWDKCERGDWMLWLAGKLCGDSETQSRKALVLAACECARLSLPFVKKGETRPLQAIETAEKWARGEEGIILEDVRAAADAADAAAFAAADAADAAIAAARAAATAHSAAAADAAAIAAAAAADAAAAHAAHVRTSVLKQCADIVRKYYPKVDDLWF